MKPEKNYVVGRGKFYVDSRYIGTTQLVRVLSTGRECRIVVQTDEISEENKLMLTRFMRGGKPSERRYVLAYEADNPCGGNDGFHAVNAVIVEAHRDYKHLAHDHGERWCDMQFVFAVDFGEIELSDESDDSEFPYEG